MAEETQVDQTVKKYLHHSFVELENLERHGTILKWVERARWIKLEEDVDVLTNQWCQPYIPALSYKAFSELKTCLQNGHVYLGLQASCFDDISRAIVNTLLSKRFITTGDSENLWDVLSAKHKHMRQKADPPRTRQKWLSAARAARHLSSRRNTILSIQLPSVMDMPIIVDESDSSASLHNGKTRVIDITNKLPSDTEVTTILTARLEYMKQPMAIFIRLADSIFVENLNEVSRPVRFVCFIAGPHDELTFDCLQMGRCIGALMSNPKFLTNAYVSQVADDLLSAIDRVLEESIVLPPGDWTKQNFNQSAQRWSWLLRREENINSRLRDKRATALPIETAIKTSPVVQQEHHPLKRTGKVFGCLRNDFVRKIPFYISDFTQIFDINCLAAILFIYLAALAPVITFGGLMFENTNGALGIPEMILAAGVSGIVFSLLAGQPLIIVGATGPMLILESKMYELAEQLGVDFLSWRACIGLWVVVICIVIIAFDLCGIVRQVTRFTEEIFACLVSLIFIQKAISYIVKTFKDHPIGGKRCIDASLNQTVSMNNMTYRLVDYKNTNGVLSGMEHPCYSLMAVIVITLTFGFSHFIRKIRTSVFFPLKVRHIISDFGVIISVALVVVFDNMIGDNFTKKLSIKNDYFSRNWFVNPLGDEKSIGIGYIFLAVLPAFLVSIILFIETGITAVMLDKKENKLSKGFGYHLDLLVVAVLTGAVSLFGLPWICTSPVNSLSHFHTLTVLSSNHPPGTNPYIMKVQEQRVTNIIIHVMITSSLFLAPMLERISVAILYGVFLYLGFTSLARIEFIHRLQLLFIPYTLHPDSRFVRKVKTMKIHCFTVIQLLCLVILAVVKETSFAAIFPFLILCLVPLRKCLRIIFTEEELEDLDSPESEDEFGTAEEFETVHVPMVY